MRKEGLTFMISTTGTQTKMWIHGHPHHLQIEREGRRRPLRQPLHLPSLIDLTLCGTYQLQRDAPESSNRTGMRMPPQQ
jgi:hypothetical protein